jgi:quinoprotein glucose dehydrogenase
VEAKRSDGEPLATGEAIFNQICAACHGLDRQGNKAQNVPSLVGVEQRLKPADVLAVNFGRPAATFVAFPKRDVFMAGG